MGMEVDEIAEIKKAIEAVHVGLQADLEHGVAWMNDEASAKFVREYPFLNTALGFLFKHLPEQ